MSRSAAIPCPAARPVVAESPHAGRPGARASGWALGSVALIVAACGGGGDAGSAGSLASAAATTATAMPAPAITAIAATTATALTTGATSSDTTAAALSVTLAVEGQTFTLAGTGRVSYGASAAWVTKEVGGTVDCTNQFFGGDPSPGVLKTCQGSDALVVIPTPAPTPAPAPPSIPAPPTLPGSLMPVVNASKIPGPAVGYSTDRIQVNTWTMPAASDIGDFREGCDYSNFSYADPIVSPGKPGAHLHVFFGNTGIDNNSTAQSIANSGNSTCNGGTLNRTAYWMPAIIDTRDGSPVKPGPTLMYYKQGYDGVTGPSIKPFPAGLRMVAGDAASTTGRDRSVFSCTRADGTTVSGSRSIPPDCAAGTLMNVGVVFPQCWDGVNLDSPDHKSHMADVSGGKCPSTHPVPLTSITIQMFYPVPDAQASAHWRLSSDNYDTSKPGGLSLHADWFNGWNQDILKTWTTLCLNATMNCFANLVGDGRVLY